MSPLLQIGVASEYQTVCLKLHVSIVFTRTFTVGIKETGNNHFLLEIGAMSNLPFCSNIQKLQIIHGK